MKLTWKQRLTGHVEDQQKPLPPIGTFNGMTLNDWRESIDHIVYARQLFNDPKFRDLLSVLNNSHPRVNVHDPSATVAAVHLGMVHGYHQLLGLLLSLTQTQEKPQPVIEADYGAEQYLR